MPYHRRLPVWHSQYHFFGYRSVLHPMFHIQMQVMMFAVASCHEWNIDLYFGFAHDTFSLIRKTAEHYRIRSGKSYFHGVRCRNGEIVFSDTGIGIRIILPYVFSHGGNHFQYIVIILAINDKFSVKSPPGFIGRTRQYRDGAPPIETATRSISSFFCNESDIASKSSRTFSGLL